MSTQTVETLESGRADAPFAHLAARLSSDFATVGAAGVHELVERARARFSDARIQAFVPILVARAVRAALGRQPG
ncbi:MAG TPA: hypothetical protein VG674_26890 [Amycolatopsis sp.]|jgi:hypothetical protein|nr:hypothetical protein [Amycolatopsis sp.]